MTLEPADWEHKVAEEFSDAEKEIIAEGKKAAAAIRAGVLRVRKSKLAEEIEKIEQEIEQAVSDSEGYHPPEPRPAPGPVVSTGADSADDADTEPAERLKDGERDTATVRLDPVQGGVGAPIAAQVGQAGAPPQEPETAPEPEAEEPVEDEPVEAQDEVSHPDDAADSDSTNADSEAHDES